MKILQSIMMSVLMVMSMGHQSKIDPAGCLQIDIMLLGDFSTSVDGHEQFVTDAFDEFVEKFELDEEGVKIGVVGFTDEGVLLSKLTSDTSEIHQGIRQWAALDYGDGGSTNLGSALSIAEQQFKSFGRPFYRKLIVVICDGQPDSPDEVMSMASQIKNSNIGICGVLINGSTTNSDYMKRLSSEYCYVETNFTNLVTELKKLDVCL